MNNPPRRRRGRAVVIGALLAIAGGPALLGGVSRADSVPYTDPNSDGGITLYGPNGDEVTGGSTGAPLSIQIARAVGAGPAPVGYRDAALFSIWVPTAGDPEQWSGAPLGVPTVLTAEQGSQPLTATKIDDRSLEQELITASGPSKGAVAGYYELRMYGVQTGPASPADYFTADLKVDLGTRTWVVVRSGKDAVAGKVTPIAPSLVKAPPVGPGAVALGLQPPKGTPSPSPGAGAASTGAVAASSAAPAREKASSASVGSTSAAAAVSPSAQPSQKAGATGAHSSPSQPGAGNGGRLTVIAVVLLAGAALLWRRTHRT